MKSLSAIVLVLVLAGCGQKNGAAIEALRPEMNTVRQRWAVLATGLAQADGRPPLDIATLSPPLHYVDRPSSERNVEVVMFDELSQPEIESDRMTRPDLILSGDLARCLRWTGPHNPMSASAMDDRGGDEMMTSCRAAAAWPYLLVLRPIGYARPIAISAESYTPGTLRLEAILVDTRTFQPLGAVTVQGQSAATISFSTQQGSSAEESQRSMEATAYSTLWSSTRAALATALTRGASRFEAH